MTSVSATSVAASANSAAPIRVRRVLIPLDGSEFSRQILPLLRGFFASDDVELVLLRVANVQEADTTNAAKQAALEEELEMDATALRDLGFAVSVQVAMGNPTQCIIDAAARGAIDVVAMASIGSGTFEGLDNDVGNSIGEHVLRNVSVPVLLMRAQDEDAGQ